ncbi:TRAP transporter large permease [Castellaniella sp. S9]|uniref:TRAP transporter large permease n=1 Tax=Castellaniella sp. S9 TaxID=2993652 RepID=UPI0022B2B49B|nr:TRAP transporter large permease [Castellaniella sp. S9]
MIWLFLALLILLILLRSPIAVALGLPALVWLFLNDISLGITTQRIYGTLNNSVLLAVPMFLLAGRLMNLLQVTDKIFDFAMAIVGHIRGGLGHVVVVTSMIFSAMSGSAAADAVGVGTITVKAARERGYDPEFAAAITLSASTLAPIIPPSIIMIIYGATANVSIGRLFIGGIVPGIIFASLLLIAVSIIARRRQYPLMGQFSFRRLFTTLRKAFLVLLTPVIIIGGIFFGFFTPTEAATIAVLYILLLGMWYRTLTWRGMYREFVNAGSTVGVLMLVVGISGLDGWVFTREQLPVLFMNGVSGMVSEPWAILLVLLAVILVLGMFMDATPIILMVAPVMMPIVASAGIDPVHFGVLFCMTCVVGLITPPVGVALYGVASVSKLPMERIFWATIPFFLSLIGGMIFLVFVPSAVTFAPNLFLN